MIAKNIIRIILILLVITANIGCDQFSKKIVKRSVLPYETIRVLNDHLTVTRVENSGAFLSAGDAMSKTSKQIFLTLIPIIAMVLGLVYLFLKPVSGNMLIGLCFVIGGGVGNLFDRIMYGSVTDFLFVKVGIFETGIFNLADVSIMTGMLFIFIQFFTRNGRS
ncbi:MAG TPA: signal peptidase II [Chitinophagaceae bacterium]|jgi:signal peptidase II|nr:signal peptidase II [Chitinophagaceae bacterium]